MTSELSTDTTLSHYRIVAKIGTLVGDTKAQPPTVILTWLAEMKK